MMADVETKISAVVPQRASGEQRRQLWEESLAENTKLGHKYKEIIENLKPADKKELLKVVTTAVSETASQPLYSGPGHALGGQGTNLSSAERRAKSVAAFEKREQDKAEKKQQEAQASQQAVDHLLNTDCLPILGPEKQERLRQKISQLRAESQTYTSENLLSQSSKGSPSQSSGSNSNSSDARTSAQQRTPSSDTASSQHSIRFLRFGLS